MEHGMKIIPNLHEIMPDEAAGRIRPIYEDIQQVLRVPFVNFIFRTLANYPDYLESAWQDLRPSLRSRAFEQAADEIRVEGLLDRVPNASEVAWEGLADLEQIRPFNDTIHYVLPKLLLIATAWHEGLRGGGTGTDAGDGIPAGVAEGTTKIPMVDPKSATGRVKELFQDIRERHRHPGVASYYRALGHWPEFLGTAWERIRPIVGSPEYDERKSRVVARAEMELRNVLGAGATGGGGANRIPQESMEEVRAILSVFRYRLIPDLLLDVSLIKAMLDGPEAARRSRFSVAADG
jgi:hypothetical protein